MEPLPTEQLGLATVPSDIADRLRSIADHITRVVDDYFDDPELSTAALRLLTRVAVADPAPFHRKSNDAMLAAAVAWMAAKANDAFGGARTVKGLMAAFGQTGSAAQRAKGLLDSIGPYLGGRVVERPGRPGAAHLPAPRGDDRGAGPLAHRLDRAAVNFADMATARASAQARDQGTAVSTRASCGRHTLALRAFTADAVSPTSPDRQRHSSLGAIANFRRWSCR